MAEGNAKRGYGIWVYIAEKVMAWKWVLSEYHLGVELLIFIQFFSNLSHKLYIFLIKNIKLFILFE